MSLRAFPRKQKNEHNLEEWKNIGFHFRSPEQFVGIMRLAWAEAMPVVTGRNGRVRLWTPGAGIEVWMTGDWRGRFRSACPHVFGPSDGGFVVGDTEAAAPRRRGWVALRAVPEPVALEERERPWDAAPLALRAVYVAGALRQPVYSGDAVSVSGFACSLDFTGDIAYDRDAAEYSDVPATDVSEPTGRRNHAVAGGGRYIARPELAEVARGEVMMVRGIVRSVQWRTNPVFKAGFYLLVIDMNGVLLNVAADIDHVTGHPAEGERVRGRVILHATVAADTTRLAEEEGARACYARGAALMAGGQVDAGIDQWSHAVKRLAALIGERSDLVPVLVDLLYQRGQALAQSAQYTAAQSDFTQTLHLIGRLDAEKLDMGLARAMALSASGRCKIELNQLRGALDDLNEAAVLWSGAVERGMDGATGELAACLHSCGLVKQRTGDAQAALADYDRSIALCGEVGAGRPGVLFELLAHTMHNRAFVLGLLGRWNESVAGYKASIRLRRALLDQGAKVDVGGLAKSYFNLAARQATEELWDDALRNFAIAIRLRADRLPRCAEHEEAIVWALRRRAEIYMRTEDWLQAEREYDKAVRMQAHLCADEGAERRTDRTEGQADRTEGQADRMEGQTDRTEGQTDDRRARLAQLHLRRALARLHGGKLAEAAADCDEALRQSGENPHAVPGADGALDSVPACAQMQDSAALSRDVCQAYYIRGLIRQRMGLKTAAMSDWHLSVHMLDQLARSGLPLPKNAANMRDILALAAADDLSGTG